MPINHGKRYSKWERYYLDMVAGQLADKSDMYIQAYAICANLGRTYVAVCKQLEIRRGWYWAA